MRIETVVSAREEPAKPEAVERAAAILRMGGFLVHPTSTVYGIGAAPTAELDRAVNRLKGRALDEPILRLAAGTEELRRDRSDLAWSADAERLAERFWPGGLTLVLEDGSETGLAVRVDPHPFPRAVVRSWGDLLSSTSLNRTGNPPARDPVAARDIIESWPDPATPCVLADGGELAPSPPSTVLSLRAEPPRLLREGAVDRSEIEKCLEREIEPGHQ